MEWSAWKKALELYVNTPELIAASIPIGMAIFGFAWWLRSHTGKQHVAALNTQIATLDAQNEDLQERLRHAREDAGNAKATQERIAGELKFVTSEVEQLKSIMQKPVPLQPHLQNIYISTLASGTSQLAVHMVSLTQANTTLGAKLSEITGKLEAPGARDHVRFTEGTDRSDTPTPLKKIMLE
jgi:hypothetical protein